MASNKSEEIREYFQNLIKTTREETGDLLKGCPDHSVFTFICNIYYYYPNADDDALYAIVDGPNDGSIDAICNAFTEEENPIEFVQTKFRRDFDITEAKGELADMRETAANLKSQHFSKYSDKLCHRFESCRDESTDMASFRYVYFTAAVPLPKKKKQAIDELTKDRDDVEIFFGDDIKAYIECEEKKTGRVDSDSLVILFSLYDTRERAFQNPETASRGMNSLKPLDSCCKNIYMFSADYN